MKRSFCALEHEARGLLDGSVTTLIRPVKGAPDNVREVVPSLLLNRGDLFDFRLYLDNPKAIRCPFGPPGTRLAVREAWKLGEYSCDDEPQDDDHECDGHCKQRYVYYQATPRVGYRPVPDKTTIRYLDDSTPLTEFYETGYRSPATMPAWAVRTHVTVASVRVMRCGEIGAALACLAGHEVDGTASGARDALQQWWAKNYGKRYPFASSWAWVVGVKL